MGSSRLDETHRLHARGETVAVIDTAGRAGKAVEVAAHDDVLVRVGRALDGRDDVVVLDRPHLEPVADVELELDRLALLDHRLDSVWDCESSSLMSGNTGSLSHDET